MSTSTGYRPMLRLENKERQSIEELKGMEANETATHIGIDHLEDLLSYDLRREMERNQGKYSKMPGWGCVVQELDTLYCAR